jgi:hypothetical protein
VERGYRFQSDGGYGTGEYFESGESEVYPFKKITYRESEQQQEQEQEQEQQQLRTDFSSSSAESFTSHSVNPLGDPRGG